MWRRHCRHLWCMSFLLFCGYALGSDDQSSPVNSGNVDFDLDSVLYIHDYGKNVVQRPAYAGERDNVPSKSYLGPSESCTESGEGRDEDTESYTASTESSVDEDKSSTNGDTNHQATDLEEKNIAAIRNAMPKSTPKVLDALVQAKSGLLASLNLGALAGITPTAYNQPAPMGFPPPEVTAFQTNPTSASLLEPVVNAFPPDLKTFLSRPNYVSTFFDPTLQKDYTTLQLLLSTPLTSSNNARMLRLWLRRWFAVGFQPSIYNMAYVSTAVLGTTALAALQTDFQKYVSVQPSWIKADYYRWFGVNSTTGVSLLANYSVVPISTSFDQTSLANLNVTSTSYDLMDDAPLGCLYTNISNYLAFAQSIVTNYIGSVTSGTNLSTVTGLLEADASGFIQYNKTNFTPALQNYRTDVGGAIRHSQLLFMMHSNIKVLAVPNADQVPPELIRFTSPFSCVWSTNDQVLMDEYKPNSIPSNCSFQFVDTIDALGTNDFLIIMIEHPYNRIYRQLRTSMMLGHIHSEATYVSALSAVANDGSTFPGSPFCSAITGGTYANGADCPTTMSSLLGNAQVFVGFIEELDNARAILEYTVGMVLPSTPPQDYYTGVNELADWQLIYINSTFNASFSMDLNVYSQAYSKLSYRMSIVEFLDGQIH